MKYFCGYTLETLNRMLKIFHAIFYLKTKGEKDVTYLAL